MDFSFLIAAAAVVFAYGMLAGPLGRSAITPPMVFVAFGVLVSPDALGLLSLEPDSRGVEVLAEVTLTLVLFSDATRINFSSLTRSAALPARLLCVGMPLTILLGGIVAALLFPSWTVFEAMLLAAMLAATDAALGQAVVTRPEVPVRIRQTINVESGLNDGLALPVVLFFATFASAQTNVQPWSYWLVFALTQMGLGFAIGIGVGVAGGLLMILGNRKHWMVDPHGQLCEVALALLAFSAATAIEGNGFIAAFVAGLVLGNVDRRTCGCLSDFLEAEGQLLILIAFILFGAMMVWPAIVAATWEMVLYAGLSLTLIRGLPVALGLYRSKLRIPTGLFLAWFGPRGLASILFALIVIGDFPLQHRNAIVNTLALTVLLSVYLHGLSAGWLSTAYGQYLERAGRPEAEHQAATESPLRTFGRMLHRRVVNE